MPLIVPHEGDRQLLTELLSHGEDWLLRLYAQDLVVREDDTHEKYEAAEATFPGYSPKRVTRCIGEHGWSLPKIQPPSGCPPWTTRSKVGSSHHQKHQWECMGGKQVIFGYFMTGAESRDLIAVEPFNESQTMTAGKLLFITPAFENT